MSNFDPKALLNIEIQTGELSTEKVLIREGEHIFTVGKPDIRAGEGKGDDKKPWARLEIPMQLDDADVLREMNVDKATTRLSFFLDLDENGGLATGTNQNIALGQLFEACGLHGEDATISQVEGRRVIGKTVQKSNENNEWNEVTRVVAID